MPPLKVFVATTRTQGHRDNDVAHVDGPELVTFAMSCDRDSGTPDGSGDNRCGSARAFTGLNSRKVTTTAEIAQRDLTLVQYRNVVHRGLVTAGFDDDPELRHEAEQTADELARIAAGWPVGTVVERRGDAIVVRAWPTFSTTGQRTRATASATRSDVAAIAAGSARTRTVGTPAGHPLTARFHRLVLLAAHADACRRACRWSRQDSSEPAPHSTVETP